MTLSFAALVAACGGSNVGGNGPCDVDPPDPACATECVLDTECPLGYFCGDDGTCNAECTAGGDECPSDQECDQRGRCVPDDGIPDPPDGGGNNCPSVHLTPEAQTPTVQLLIDQSGSMSEDFGDTTRYPAMRDALVDDVTGVITELEGQIIFGASLYTFDEEVEVECPRITGVPRALNNLDAITTLLDANGPSGDTPTGDSIDAIVDDFAANPPPANSPPIILLVTDGEPDTCEQPNPQEGQGESIAAAERAYQAGIDLFVLSVGADVSLDHLQDVANAGVGLPVGGVMNAPFFVANNPAELSTRLSGLIRGVLSCELEIDGTVDLARADEARVTVNGEPQTFGTDWEMVDRDTMRLIGQACDDFLAAVNPTLDAEFPCGVVVD